MTEKIKEQRGKEAEERNVNGFSVFDALQFESISIG
jgi:hypothetical protein